MSTTHPHRQVFDQEFAKARDIVVAMSTHVENAIRGAIQGLVERDVTSCTRVIEGDDVVNRMQYELRDVCFTIILTQAPVARDLREVMGFYHMASELERMGDHCVGIARIARDLVIHPPLPSSDDIQKMGDLCVQQVHDMAEALVDRDLDAARTIAGRDQDVNTIYRRLFDNAVRALSERNHDAYEVTQSILVAHHLERIGDRVTNLAEDLVFLETGEVEELG